MKNSRFNSGASNKQGQNGKGDGDRTSKYKEFKKNYDKIKWQRPSGNSPSTNSE
jgi:hypothetical protein